VLIVTEFDHRQSRRDYLRGRLDKADLDPNPMIQLEKWISAAKEPGHPDPTAMILATADSDGQPSARAVLLKHMDQDGLCWYSDARSRKGRELATNPLASVLFFWPHWERQVRVDGRVVTLSAAQSDHYFASRPLGSRMAAAASEQSAPIADRKALENRLEAIRNRYPGGNVPRPPAWTGYRLLPHRFEFWQGRENRLHDRLQFDRNGEGWAITRLMP
jgi:pyridoxamine 5'-phosphate oxidase